MRRAWLARGVVAAVVTAGLAVAVGGEQAGAAPSYELVSTGTGAGSVVGTPSMSGDGQIVAWTQAGAGCGGASATAVLLRDRQAKATIPLPPAGQCPGGNGTPPTALPALSRDGCHVAYVVDHDDGTGKVASDIYALDRCTSSTPVALTAGEWRAKGAATVQRVVTSSAGRFVAFAATDGGGGSHLFVIDRNKPGVVATVPVDGASLPAVGDDANNRLAFVAAGQVHITTAAAPDAGTSIGAPPNGGTIVSVSVAATGSFVAFESQAGGGRATFVWNGSGLSPIDAQASAGEPSLSQDGSLIAYSRTSTACGACRELVITKSANPSAPLAVATPLAPGLQHPLLSSSGRQLALVAAPGTAASARGSGATQIFALGPELSAPDADFGAVAIGTPSAAQTITVTNAGTVAVTPSVLQTNDAEFAIVSGGTCQIGQAIAVGATCTVQVTFTPSRAGPAQATLTIGEQGAWDSPTAQSTLTGTGEAAVLTASPSSVDFGSVPLGGRAGTRTISVSNSGSQPTTIGTVVITGGQASDFPLAGNTCSGTDLAAGASCTVSVGFVPGSRGTRSATITVAGTSGGTVSIDVRGIGLFNPALSMSPTSADYGRVIVGTGSSPHVFQVTNTGNVPNDVGTARLSGAQSGQFSITADGCGGRTLSVGATCSITVAFLATSAGNDSATVTVSGTGGSNTSARLTGQAALQPVLAVSPGTLTPGQVATAVGANFIPDSQVTLAWDQGHGTFVATADADGAFTISIWMLPEGAVTGTRYLQVANASPPVRAAALILETGDTSGPSGPSFRASPAFASEVP